MNEAGTGWYTRRGERVRGPYPQDRIRRYVLLGRIRDNDEVCCEGGEWAPLSACPELIPDVMKLAPTEENRRKLERARMQADERRPGDRRQRQGRVPARVRERRSGFERRRPESAEALRYRALRHAGPPLVRVRAMLRRHPLALFSLAVIGLLLGYASV